MIKNIPELLEKIYKEIRNTCDIVVVGCSGGADSTLVTTLCVQALGKENVYGIGMPHDTYDLYNFNGRSKNTANKLGINYTTIPIYSISDDILTLTESAIFDLKIYNNLNQINKGNARSRARMCILYSVAHELGYNLNKKVRVVGTGNLSEDFIGYDTKGGDALADFFPIGELFKSEVYQLLDYFIVQGVLNEEDVDRIPSAGLWESQTDESELGFTYLDMEKVIRWYFYCQRVNDYDEWNKFNRVVKVENSIEKFVMDRHFANKHKHEAPSVFKLRKYIEE